MNQKCDHFISENDCDFVENQALIATKSTFNILNVSLRVHAYHKYWVEPISLHVGPGPDQSHVLWHSLAHVIGLDPRQKLVGGANVVHAPTHHVEQRRRRLVSHPVHELVGETSQ